MNLSERIIETLDNNNFEHSAIYEHQSQYYIEIGQYTPEGEDWSEIIWFNGTEAGFVEAVKQRTKDFDPNEEAEIWILQRGQNGVPESINALIDDAHWKRDRLEELLSGLLKIKVGTEV